MLGGEEVSVNYFLIKLFFVEIANLGVELRKSGYVDEKPLSKELGIQGVEKDFGKFKLTVLWGIEYFLGQFNQNGAEVLHIRKDSLNILKVYL